jgi:ABC-type phosphate transport system substrate-binding protein
MAKMHDSSVASLALSTTLIALAFPWGGAQGFPTFPQVNSVAKGTAVRITGSKNLASLSQSLQSGFEKQYPGSKVTLSFTDTEPALDQVLSGKADLAAIGRPLTGAETAQGLVAVPVGRDKIAIVVDQKNPFKKNLTISQWAKISRGEIKNWSAVGGPNAPIQFVDRPQTDTSQAFAKYAVFQGGKFGTGSTVVAVTDTQPQAMISRLGSGGISFLPASQLASLPQLRAVAISGAKPTEAKYPFSQPLFYVYKASPNNTVKAFLGYTGTAAGQAAIVNAGVQQAINFNKLASQAAPAAQQPVTTGTAQAPAAGTKAQPAQPSNVPGQSQPGASPAGGPVGQVTGSPGPTQAAPLKAPKLGETTGQAPASAPAAPTAQQPASTAEQPSPSAGGSGASRGIPAWLWWLLLPLGLLALLLWLLPKDEDRDRSAAELTPEGEAQPSDLAPIPGEPRGGVAAAGALASGAGTLAAARLKEEHLSETPSEGVSAPEEPVPSMTGDDFTIEPPDWDVNPSETAEVVADSGLENVAPEPEPTPEPGLGGVGGAIAGAGAISAGAAAWSFLQREQSPATPPAAGSDTAEVGTAAGLPGPESVPQTGGDTDHIDATPEPGEWTFTEDLPESPAAFPTRLVDYASPDDASSAEPWEHPAVAAAGVGAGLASLQASSSQVANQGVTTSFNWFDKFKQAAFGRPKATTTSTSGTMDALPFQAGGSVIGDAGALLTGPGQVVLVPYGSREALVRWEIAPETQQNFHAQGSNQLVLRLFDVTDQDSETESLPTFQQFDLDDAGHEQRIMIPQQDRTYLAALGYLTRLGEFVEVARSGSVQIPTAS